MEEWFYELDGNRHGPIDFGELQALLASGRLTPNVLIWKEGMADWQAANTIAEFMVPPPLPSKTSPATSPATDYIGRCRTWFVQLGSGGKAGVIVCGLFMFSCCCCPIPGMIFNVEDGSAGTSSSSSPNSGSSSELTLGDEFLLGDFKYRILSTANRRTVGNQFIRERADNGAIFVIVSYTLENCTNETQTVLADDMKLVDTEGRTFDPSSKANTALLAEDGKDFLLSELQPGIARTMKTAFELPLSSLNGDITLIVPEKGMFSSGETRIRIK